MLLDCVLSHGPMSDHYLCSAQGADGVLSRGPMGDPCLCSAHDARVCSWMQCSPMAHELSPPVQRTGGSWMLVDGVLYLGPMGDPCLCNEQGACGCSWMGCSPMDP